MLDQYEGTNPELTRTMIAHDLGLDVPIHIQYIRWVGGIVLHGNLGESLWRGTPVIDDLISRLPVTFELGLLALIFATLISLPIGIFSAIRQDTIGDYVGRSIAVLFIAVPGFWVATIVIVFASIWWGWSPDIMLVRFTQDPLGNLAQFALPAFIMGMGMAGVTMRMMRSMMLEIMRQDYVRTAWAKGLAERTVILRHVLRNALIPVVTIVGLQLPVLIGGAVIIEQIFALPGVGLLMFNAIGQRDYPVVVGVMLVISVFIMVVNLVVDLSYGLLDPRVGYK
jgi:peptide/nickel transport system permease protein